MPPCPHYSSVPVFVHCAQQALVAALRKIREGGEGGVGGEGGEGGVGGCREKRKRRIPYLHAYRDHF